MAAKKPLGKVIGGILIQNVAGMSPAVRSQVANWLRRVGDGIRKGGDQYTTGRFSARFHLPVGGKK